MYKYHEFLQLGYLSSQTKNTPTLHYTFNEDLKVYSFNELLGVGHNLLLQETEKVIKENQSKDIVIPISGGLDSRLILSAVAECKNVEDIKTYTFGSPKALDYEIGNYIGKKIGSNHQNIDLFDYKYKIDDLFKFSEKVENPTVMFHNLPESNLIFDNNSIILSGFLGDVVSGKRLGFMEGDTEKIKRDYFNSMISRNDFSIESSKLVNQLVDNTDFQNLENLTEIEKIYILEHNFKLNFNQVFGNIDTDNMVTPFLNTEFMNFLLSLPQEYRLNQLYYKTLIFERMSKLLRDIPVRNYHGAKYSSKKAMKNIYRTKNAIRHRLSKKISVIHSPHVNYVDFSKKIKSDISFKKLLLELLTSLNERNMNEYSNEVKKAIYNISTNNITNPYSYLLLASLEVYLQQGKFKIHEEIF